MLLSLVSLAVLVLLSLAPGILAGTTGGRRGGDQLLQVGGGGDLGPGGLEADLDGDAAVLVGAVLDDVFGILGLPHLLGQLATPLGQLEVYKDVGLGEVSAGLEVSASEEAGREDFPGTAGLPVGDPQDEAGVGPLLLQDVAGSDVTEEKLDTSLLLDQSDHHLRLVLHPDGILEPPLLLDQEAGHLVSVGRGDNQVTLQAPLLDLVAVLFSLVNLLLQLVVLSIELDHFLSLLLVVILKNINFNFDSFSYIFVELDGFGMIGYGLHHLVEELD